MLRHESHVQLSATAMAKDLLTFQLAVDAADLTRAYLVLSQSLRASTYLILSNSIRTR